MPDITAKQSSPLMNAIKDHITNGNQCREGSVVDATLIKKTPRAIFFEIGEFGTGIVYGTELQDSRDILKGMNEGDSIHARVEALDGHMGYVELSLSEAGRQKAWQEVKALEESGETIRVKVASVNQGGLLGDLFGLKAFIPASQLSSGHMPHDVDGDRKKMIDELQKLVGEELEVKVITVLPRNNKLILSEREMSRVGGEDQTELLAAYKVGQVVAGIVSGIADFGVFVKFVDNPELEGLVHISEIDHRIIDSPKEAVQLNENVQVKIIDIRDGRVFLSLKALKPDPWGSVHEHYKEGQEIRGRIYKFNPFGAVIDLGNGFQGLVHVSEYGGSDEMKTAIKLGEEYGFVIAALKPDEKRIILKPLGDTRQDKFSAIATDKKKAPEESIGE